MAKVILIAEDDKNDAQLLANAIASAGLANPVVTVPNGVDVIRYLEGHAEFSDRSRFPMPSVLLLDLKMPGFTGFGVLDWLRKQSHFRHILVVVVSGLEDVKEIDRAYKLGARSFIPKPCTSEDIRNVAQTYRDHWL
jgi:CheY-like chemotaxis protein